jgi:transcriptional regulator
MYTPRQFENNNRSEILDFVQANSFGTIVTSGPKTLATHIPLEIDPSGKFLSGHISAANPQAKELTDGSEVLCIFVGPHAYISSSWYNHQNVPTWNYIAVHIYGRVKLTSGAETVEALKVMLEKYEAGSEKPVLMDDLSEEYLSKTIRGIVAFQIEISTIKASYKLSQNRDKTNHARIVDQLEKRGNHNDNAIAFEMKKRAPKSAQDEPSA